MIRNLPSDPSSSNAWQAHPTGGDGDSHSSASGERANPTIKKKRITANSFASILADVIDAPGYEDAIYWSKDGKSFRVIPKTFSEKVLEQHMKGTKFSSFFRRLIRWGFERVVLDEFPMDAFVFRHEMFQRGQASLLRTLSPYHVSRGKRGVTVQQSIVKAKKANNNNDKKSKETTATKNKVSNKGSAPDGVVSSSSRKTNPSLSSVQPPALLSSASLSLAQQQQQQQCSDQEATLALIRRQQELLLLSQLSHATNTTANNSRLGLEQSLHHPSLFAAASSSPSSLLSQRLAAVDRENNNNNNMELLAREMQLRDLLRASHANRFALPQERSISSLFANPNHHHCQIMNHPLEGSLVNSDPERLALLSMLLRQPSQEVLPRVAPIETAPRYDELFRLVNLMNRLQE